MSPPLISKAAARYTGAGGREHCSLCRHFSPRRGGRFARVLGDISPMGWCRLFSRALRGLVADASSFNGGGGGPVLSLDFMTPGTLSPLITFTRASTGTYFDSAGVMQTAAINTPRWDCDPATLQLRGLLLEDQRANSIRNSTMVGAVPGTPGTLPTNWGIAGGPAMSTQVVGTGNDGGIPYIDVRFFGTAAGTVTTLVFETATAVTAANGQAWIVSAYVSPVAGTLSGVANVQWLINETTTAGAAIKTNFSSPITVTAAPLAAQRIAYSVTLTGGGTVGAIHPRLQLNTSPSVPVNVTLRIAAPQLELGAFATSYIPTTSAAVTRAQDRCSISAANMAPWFNALTGSWFAEFVFQNPTSPNIRILASLGQAAGGSAGMVFVDPAQHVAQYDGGTALVTTSPALVVNAVSKAASTWAAGTGQVCGNGGAVLSGAMPSGFGNLSVVGICFLIPSNPGVTDNATGYLRRVSYWSRVLTAADMQAMTAP